MSIGAQHPGKCWPRLPHHCLLNCREWPFCQNLVLRPGGGQPGPACGTAATVMAVAGVVAWSGWTLSQRLQAALSWALSWWLHMAPSSLQASQHSCYLGTGQAPHSSPAPGRVMGEERLPHWGRHPTLRQAPPWCWPAAPCQCLAPDMALPLAFCKGRWLRAPSQGTPQAEPGFHCGAPLPPSMARYPVLVLYSDALLASASRASLPYPGICPLTATVPCRAQTPR